MVDQRDSESLLDFPHNFTIKVMGVDDSDFKQIVTKIVNRHIPPATQQGITELQSRKKKYISYSITFIAENRQQLDELYADLNSHPKVLMVL
ncbi:MAG TPA: DUF493 domain-containing protein [Gammaproteobacteria bacterium]|nr:DUF493 domain-containing protein [Gammaproteobacteria bacterium]